MNSQERPTFAPGILPALALRSNVSGVMRNRRAASVGSSIVIGAR